MAQCSNYTDRQLVCLPPRWRTLLKGTDPGVLGVFFFNGGGLTMGGFGVFGDARNYIV